MNRSNIEHAVIALCLQGLLILPVYFLPPEFAAGAIAVAVFLGREVAQHEYKLAQQRGWRWGQTMPVSWYEGLTAWTKDSLLDVAAPVVGCLLLALAVGGIRYGNIF